MSKPIAWIVFIPGRDAMRFHHRAAMRVQVALLKARGIVPIIKVIGG